MKRRRYYPIMTNLTEIEMRALQIPDNEIKDKPEFARRSLGEAKKRAVHRLAGDARAFLRNFLDRKLETS
jgi:hypothetical protein